MGRMWPIEDLAGMLELSVEHGVGVSGVSSWYKNRDHPTRFNGFPDALISVHSGLAFSRREVAHWRTQPRIAQPACASCGHEPPARRPGRGEMPLPLFGLPEDLSGQLCDLDDVTDTVGISKACGVTGDWVRRWNREYADFPGPLVRLGFGTLYSRSAVIAWRNAFETHG